MDELAPAAPQAAAVASAEVPVSAVLLAQAEAGFADAKLIRDIAKTFKAATMPAKDLASIAAALKSAGDIDRQAAKALHDAKEMRRREQLGSRGTGGKLSGAHRALLKNLRDALVADGEEVPAALEAPPPPPMPEGASPGA